MQTKADVTHKVEKLIHKGYVITVTAPAVRTGGFTAHLSIRKDAKTYTDDTPVHSGKGFRTANEALEAGLEIGRQLVDGGFQASQSVKT
jgi:hypothetical protein